MKIDIEITGTQNYKAIALTPEILNHAGTTALRIVESETMEEIPFFIHSAEIYEGTFVPFSASKEAIFEVESVTEPRGITTVTILGLKDTNATMENIPVTGLHIETDSIFQRVFSFGRQNTTLYRSYFSGTLSYDTSILFTGLPAPDQLIFTIADHNDSPIEINSIVVEYYVNYLVFMAEYGKEYSLVFGGELTRPRYDIENFRNLIIQEGYDRVSFTGEARLLEVTYIPDRDFSLMFNIFFIAAAILLSFIGLRGFLKKRV